MLLLKDQVHQEGHSEQYLCMLANGDVIVYITN